MFTNALFKKNVLVGLNTDLWVGQISQLWVEYPEFLLAVGVAMAIASVVMSQISALFSSDKNGIEGNVVLKIHTSYYARKGVGQ